MTKRPDDLDAMIQQLEDEDPAFPARLAAEIRRQRLVSDGVASRKANRMTQAAVAAVMGVAQSVVAEIESGRADIRYSTLDRYIDAVTKGRMRLDLVDARRDAVDAVA